MTTPIYVLGGYQTDFARNWTREGDELFDLFSHTVESGMASTRLEPGDIDAAHIGNFTAELFCGQGHLGGFFAAVHPQFAGIPAARHEGCLCLWELGRIGGKRGHRGKSLWIDRGGRH